jgi:hypothetical protein
MVLRTGAALHVMMKKTCRVLDNEVDVCLVIDPAECALDPSFRPISRRPHQVSC